MTRYAIGDIQGCHEPLVELLRKMRFKADRDQVYFTGDLVNRGPQSLRVLRLVKSLGANAHTVLGNHDLHLLAHHFDPNRPMRRGDTLSHILRARDREPLIHPQLAPHRIHQPVPIPSPLDVRDGLRPGRVVVAVSSRTRHELLEATAYAAHAMTRCASAGHPRQ